MFRGPGRCTPGAHPLSGHRAALSPLDIRDQAAARSIHHQGCEALDRNQGNVSYDTRSTRPGRTVVRSTTSVVAGSQKASGHIQGREGSMGITPHVHCCRSIPHHAQPLRTPPHPSRRRLVPRHPPKDRNPDGPRGFHSGIAPRKALALPPFRSGVLGRCPDTISTPARSRVIWRLYASHSSLSKRNHGSRQEVQRS
jgi:hypothetical protein